MLKFKNISLTAGDSLLFKLNYLELVPGLVALVGRNGSGKSSFIQSILNDFEGLQGQIELNNKVLDQYSKSELSTEIAVVYSKVEIFGDYEVKDILDLGRIPYQNRLARSTEEDTVIINTVAVDLGISSFLNRRFATLSDGEKQLIMIARAFVQETKIILMDEPTAFLDLVNRNLLVKQLSEKAVKNGKLILFSTHDIDLIDKYCQDVLFIHEKEMIKMSKTLPYADQIKTIFNL